jgi:hypothetical protein
MFVPLLRFFRAFKFVLFLNTYFQAELQAISAVIESRKHAKMEGAAGTICMQHACSTEEKMQVEF